MEFEILGDPADGPTLDLDHEQFAYAGKFVMSSTGKSVVRDDGTIVGATAFDEDRSELDTARLRYVTVRNDRQGEGLGSQVLGFTAEYLVGSGYDRVLIAANNPIAYRACYRAGFEFTGRETGIAELVLQYAPDTVPDPDRYRQGLAVFRGRDLPEQHRAVLSTDEPPAVVELPSDDG